MGLIYSILIGFVHLFFVVTDIFFVMVIVKTVYGKWRPSWLKQAADAIEPIMATAVDYAGNISLKIIGKRYSERTLMILFIICLSFIRLIVTSLL
jgi:hypothetical protein